jgi:4-amino-4-deoxy-L-arabinose transferase-like glycosyltransferase
MRALECLVSPDPSLLARARTAQVEIVVPVRDEERDLGPSIRRLVGYLSTRFPFRTVVTIADNGSTDRTPAVARALAGEFTGVRTVRLDQSGRGRALRSVWSASEADVLAYMDVDLSTDLNALLPLVAPLLSGHSDLAIGTRLARGARVIRGPRRELISRCYNALLHATLGAGFSDAQCGFKAIRADQARLLLPLTRDTGWFFDSELLVLAERAGLRIHEVPVDWVDDPDSRVKVVATALADMRGIARMLQGFLVLPAFAVAYLVAGPPRLGRRLLQLLAGGAAVIVAAGWWVAIVQLTPAADRPYIGGSTGNSVLQLALGYNGLGRLTGNETGSVGFRGGAGPSFSGSAGLTRLLAADMGGQVSWLLPAALLALAALAWLSWGATRTNRVRAAALLWGGWLLVTGGVFSFMAGIIHPYYTIALAPAIGALTGIGAVELWRRREHTAARLALAAGIATTALWAYLLLNRTPSWLPWLRAVVVLGGLLAAAAVLAGPALARLAATGRGRMVLAAAPIPLALVTALAGPAAYSIDTAATGHTGALPSAGPAVAGAFGGGGGGFPGGASGTPSRGTGSARARGGFPQGSGAGSVPSGTSGTPFRGGGAAPGGARGGSGGAPAGGPGGGLAGNTTVASALTRLLRTGATGYRWAAATVGAESAAPLQLASGEPVMAIGGFNGTDDAPALAEFERMVAAGEIHYFVGANQASFGGGSGPAAQITAWVRARFRAETVGGETVYDLTRAR